LALNKLLSAGLSSLPRNSRDALLAERRTLGRLVNLVGKMESLPPDTMTKLVTPRNAAVHRNESPSSLDARQALEIAAEIVRLVEPLPTDQ
jgi:hypothetical protein